MLPQRWPAALGLVAVVAASALGEDDNPTQTWLLLGGGRRTLDLEWTDAGNMAGTDPAVANKYSWEGVQAYETSLSVGIFSGKSSFRWGLDYGLIYAGQAQVTDYVSEPDSVVESTADKGYLLDMSMAYGVRFTTFGGAVRFTPEVGYAWSRQNLWQTVGRQIEPDNGNYYPDLDSVYQADWYGPWVGGSLSWRCWRRVVVHGRFEYHIAKFNAYGDLNLATTVEHPKSFTQSANATGLSTALSVSYVQSSNTIWYVRYAQDHLQAEPGTDTLHFIDGTSVSTRLNEVTSDAQTISIGFCFGL